MRYGAHAMQVLLSEVVRAGAHRERLEAKVFGGGAVLVSLTMLNIGERNADFVLHYLQAERIRIAAQHLRGKLPRRISFFPFSGRVTVKKLHPQHNELLVQHEKQALAQAMLMPQRMKGDLPAGAVHAPSASLRRTI